MSRIRIPPPKGANKGSHKSSAIEVDRRVMVIYKLVCSGIRRGDAIHDFVRQMNKLTPDEQKEKGWENWIPFYVHRATIFLYLKRVRTMFAEIGKIDAEEQRGELIEQAYEVYYEAKTSGHHSAAAMALREIARLRGLSTENFTGNMLLSYKIVPRDRSKENEQ